MAVATSTRKNYQAPLRKYTEWCTAHRYDPSPHLITEQRATEFLAELALTGSLSGGTLKGYRSALSTAWEESLAEGDNPLQGTHVARAVQGISRLKRESDSEARTARGVTIELTPSLLARILPSLSDIQFNRMGPSALNTHLCWAAACVGVYGLLRPSEFLGVYRNRNSALAAGSIKFFANTNSVLPQELLPTSGRVQDYKIPDRFTLNLGPTKADQLAQNAPVTIAAPMCVKALWYWLHIQRNLATPQQSQGGTPPEYVFAIPGQPPLSQAHLLKTLREWLTPVIGSSFLLTGRCFRRGGASELVATGAPIPDIMSAGRWKSAAMVNVYSAQSAKEQRAVSQSRSMDPTCGISAQQ